MAMRDKVLNEVIQWAGAQAKIRVVLLTSSRAREDSEVDQFSDYDVELYVTDIRSYAENGNWLQKFGEVLLLLPEKRILLGMDQPSRLVIYKDGTKIDFTIAHIDILKRIADLPSLPDWLDDGYRVLLDKDDLTINLRKPSYKAYIPEKPSENEYQELVVDFWWDAVYVAKNLWRDDILPAKYSSDYVIRYRILLKMLEWYVQVRRKWKCRMGYQGKGVKSMLSKREWDELEGSFSGVSIEENWEALFNTMRFFRKISEAVASDLGYKYPYDLDENVSKYIKKIRRDKGTVS